MRNVFAAIIAIVLTGNAVVPVSAYAAGYVGHETYYSHHQQPRCWVEWRHGRRVTVCPHR